MKKFYLYVLAFVNSSIFATAQEPKPSFSITDMHVAGINPQRANTQKTSTEVEETKEPNNDKCNFGFTKAVFISNQNSENDYVVFEVPDMSASELKASVFTTLSSMFKSPKDVITNISDNMIQLEGYGERVYSSGTEYGRKDVAFSIVIQFKDGKVRYNKPVINQIYTDWPLSGMARLDMSKSLSTLIDEGQPRKSVEYYFNNLIKKINSQLEKSNDW